MLEMIMNTINNHMGAILISNTIRLLIIIILLIFVLVLSASLSFARSLRVSLLVISLLPLNNLCHEAMHPRGSAEKAHDHYYGCYPSLLSLSLLSLLQPLFMNSLCPEAVHPRGPAEGACYHFYD